MTEPKVEFDLKEIEDQEVREQFDQFRRWHQFREDRKTPAIQTFSGEISDDQDIDLYVNGEVYGAIGRYEFVSGTTPYWRNMLYTGAGGAVYFSQDPTNSSSNFVRIRGNSNNNTALKYRVTVFYRGTSNAN